MGLLGTTLDIGGQQARWERWLVPAYRPHDRSLRADRRRVVLEALLPGKTLAELDRFDRTQLADVVGVCRASRSLSDAGRTLFAASRARSILTTPIDCASTWRASA